MTAQQDRDALAGEYVLGTLDADERAQAEALIRDSAAFAALVADWERRLGELAALVEPVEPPPSTWEAIRQRLAGHPAGRAVWLPARGAPLPAPAAHATSAAAGASRAMDGTVVALRRNLRLWQRVAGGMGALAAAVIALVVLREMRPDLMPPALRPPVQVVEKPVEIVRTVEVPSSRPAPFVAVFQKDDAAPAFLLTVDPQRRSVSVRRLGAEPIAEKSYELWILPAGTTVPRSLGLLADQDFTVRPAADYDLPTLNTATFGISLEPAGGSPSGAPTGPVLHGRLTQAAPPGFGAP